MKTQTIIEIAEDRLMSDLCIKWYLLNNLVSPTQEEQQTKEDIYAQINELYNKINNKQ